MVGKEKKITPHEYKKLNARINTMAGYWRTLKRYENTIESLTIEIRTLKKEMNVMRSVIQKLQKKTRCLPKVATRRYRK